MSIATLACALLGAFASAQEQDRAAGEALLVHVARGEIRSALELLERHPGLIRDWGDKALDFAVPRDLHEVVARLVELGVEPWRGMNLVATPEMVDRLVAAGAQPEQNPGVLRAVAPRARVLGDALIERLLHHGWRLDFRTALQLGQPDDARKAIPGRPRAIDLAYACASGDAALVRELLRRGASPTAADRSMENWFCDELPLHIACRWGNADIADALVEAGAEVTEGTGWPLPPGISEPRPKGGLLCRAVAEGELGVVRFLLDHGLEPDAPGREESPLARAAWLGRLEIVQALVDAGADVNLASNGAPPLLHAAAAGHVEVARYLLQRGASLDVHAAAALGWVDVVRVLTEEDPRVLEARDARFDAPLFAWAVAREQLEMARWLLESGADVNAVTPFPPLGWCETFDGEVWPGLPLPKRRDGTTAIVYADRWLDDEVVEVLLAFGATQLPEEPTPVITEPTPDAELDLMTALRTGRATVVRRYVEEARAADRDPWAALDPRLPALTLALESDDLGTLEIVVEQGLDVRARDEYGSTPLHEAAAWSKDGATIRALAALGADIHARDDRGRSVLHHAGLLGSIGAARALLELGADAYVFDGDGLGPTDRRRWRFDSYRGRVGTEDDGLIELVESHWPPR